LWSPTPFVRPTTKDTGFEITWVGHRPWYPRSQKRDLGHPAPGLIEFPGDGGATRRLSGGEAAAFLDGDGDLFDDFQAEAFEGGNVHGGVRQQADALDAEVR